MLYYDQGFAPVRMPFQGTQTISEIMRPTVYNRFRLISFKVKFIILNKYQSWPYKQMQFFLGKTRKTVW